MEVQLENKILEYGKLYGQKAAVVTKRESITYSQLSEMCLRMAQYLRNEVKEKETVLLQALPESRYVAAYLALHLLGVVVVPVEYRTNGRSIVQIQKNTDAVMLIADEKTLNQVSEYCGAESLIKVLNYREIEEGQISGEKFFPRGKNEDVYDILYTTGTTGTSKGVMTTRKSVLAAIHNEIEGTQLCEKDVLFIPIPLNHSFGIGKLRAILYVGGTVVLQNGVGMTGDLKRVMESNRCTAMLCVPSALRVIYTQAGEKIFDIMGKLRFIEVASAPFPEEMKRALMKYLPNTHIINRYGSTETPAAIYLDVYETPDKLSSIGKALSGVKIKVVDDDGNEIVNSDRKHAGRLAISGDMLMQGYYGNSQATEEVLRNGWVYSKDIAYMDDDGYLFLIGRADDVINVGGLKVAPTEIEEIAMEREEIVDCICVPVYDETTQNALQLCVVLKDGASLDEKDIKKFFMNRVESYKVPKIIRQISEVPRTYNGKIDRKKGTDDLQHS